ncbi:MAG: FlgD immunoglobulin-like domain containing protein [bacterium]
MSGVTVLFDGSIYQMWYTGYHPDVEEIGYATSTDGKNWTKYSGNPVLTKTVGAWDGNINDVCVVFANGEYKMYYSGAASGSSPHRIGLATSTDGIHWTKYSGNPVLTNGPSGSWDEDLVRRPTVLFDGTVFHIWYEGKRFGPSHFKIGYATSNDGINWQKHSGNPVLGFNNSIASSPSVLWNGFEYVMFYSSNLWSGDKIGVAFSTDGVNWQQSLANPVLSPGNPGEWDSGFIVAPTALLDGNSYKMWYSGSGSGVVGIGYAEGTNDTISGPVAYCYNYDTKTVKIYDVENKIEIDEIVVGTFLHYIKMRPGTSELWGVSRIGPIYTPDTFFVIDTKTKVVIDNFSVGYDLGNLTFTNNGDYVFTAATQYFQDPGHATKVDANSHQLIFATQVGVSPRHNELSSDESTLYVTSHYGSADLSVINASNGTLIRNVDYGGFKPQDFELSESDNKIYISNGGSGGQKRISVLSLPNYAVISSINLHKQPHYLKILPGTDFMYVYANENYVDHIYFVDVHNNLVSTIWTGRGGGGGMFELTNDEKELWAVTSDKIVIFDTQSNQVKAEIPGHFNWIDMGQPSNQPPTASAGNNQNYQCTSPAGAEVTLNGSGSSDPDGDPLTFTWRENGNILAGPSTSPTANMVLDFGSHQIELTVEDGQGGSDTDEVLITVGDTTPPTVTAAFVPIAAPNPNEDDDEEDEEENNHFYAVECRASDACDPDPRLTAIIKLPNLDDSKIELKVKKHKRVKVDLKKNRVKIEAPDPENFWTEIQNWSGIAVENAQELKINLKHKDKFDFTFDEAGNLSKINAREVTLLCLAVDATGNIGEASATLSSEPKNNHRKKEKQHKASAITANETGIPSTFGLHQNHPNPFNPETKIRFALPRASHVVLNIYNTLGQEIRTLVNDRFEAGYQSVTWDAKDDHGRNVASGLYLYQIQAGQFVQVKKMSLVR